MRSILTLALFVSLAVSLSAADTMNPQFFGTWKMNVAKSKADPGPLPKSQTVRIEPHGDGFMLTIDSVNADGTTNHSMRMATLDGKPVKADGGANPDAREAFKRINDRTLQRDVLLKGKVINTMKVVLAADGKTFTTETTGTNAQDKPIHNLGVLEKQ